jgi:hypothetical protein
VTAEIAILNAEAVALAADSAVTLSSRSRRAPKIYNTANKLFTLSKHHPVGVMIYGNASLAARGESAVLRPLTFGLSTHAPSLP